jgi:hypothetical protein
MRNLVYILFTFLTLFINSNVYAINMEIQKSEILNEKVLKDDYSSIKYDIKSHEGKIYHLFITANSKALYDKNVIKDKEGNLKIINIGTDIIIEKGDLEFMSNIKHNNFVRIIFVLFLLTTILILYFGNKYLVKHKI